MAASIDSKRLGEMMQVVLGELDELGEPTRAGKLLPSAAAKLNLTEYETATLEKTGYIRWESMIQWFSVDCVKAGFMRKSGGKWALTEPGQEALSLPPEEFVRIARAKYAASRDSKPQEGADRRDEELPADADADEVVRQTTYQQAKDQARAQIEAAIFELNPYDFQELIAELLRAMGYHVPYVAPPGPDGGIDIVAYKDPLGSSTPRIRAQIKHGQSNKVSVSVVRALEGVLRKEGDMGLIVSSGGFTSEAEREIQVSSKHIETMDLDRLIDLWQQQYEKLSERGKSLLPLIKLFFLKPTEE